MNLRVLLIARSEQLFLDAAFGNLDVDHEEFEGHWKLLVIQQLRRDANCSLSEAVECSRIGVKRALARIDCIKRASK